MGKCRTSNCTTYYNGNCEPIDPDPDIAGIGVTLAFIMTAFLSVISTTITELIRVNLSINEELFANDKFLASSVDFCRIDLDRRERWMNLMEKLAFGFSDQQLVTGIALLSAGYIRYCEISVYHFDMVTALAWMSVLTHFTTLTMIRHHQTGRIELTGAIRVCGMVILDALFCFAIITEGHRDWYNAPRCYYHCMFNDLPGNVGGKPMRWMIAGLAMIAYSYVIGLAEYFCRTGETLDRWLWYRLKFNIEDDPRRTTQRSFQGLRVVVKKSWNTLVAFLLSSTFSLLFLWSWFIFNFCCIIYVRQQASWVLRTDKGSESTWGFGQLMPVLLLMLPFLNMMQMWEEKHTEAKLRDAKQKNKQSSKIGKEGEEEKEEDDDDDNGGKKHGSEKDFFENPQRTDTEGDIGVCKPAAPKDDSKSKANTSLENTREPWRDGSDNIV